MTNNEEEDPLLKMRHWIENEMALGSSNPNRITLATASKEGVPHSRVVAIREITSKGILFFTQQGTRKVAELRQNPHASMTLWLAFQQRQVVLDGFAEPLTVQENENFWKTLPREQQLRFSAYAPTSGQSIPSSSVLDDQLRELEIKFSKSAIPMSAYYCGFHFIADSIYFYTLGSDKFSEALNYLHFQEKWHRRLLSP